MWRWKPSPQEPEDPIPTIIHPILDEREPPSWRVGGRIDTPYGAFRVVSVSITDQVDKDGDSYAEFRVTAIDDHGFKRQYGERWRQTELRYPDVGV